MEWEDTKENFVPVKHGRSAATLLTPLSVSKRNPELDEAKESFLETIKAADDPLPAWMKYIKWTQEQYATQGNKAELQQVLELATKSLSSTHRYNNDVRLLRIWIQYADCLPDPSDVFLHLAERNIGRDHALLYEAYATYLELKGNFTQVELVFQDGINRLAKPLERLKQKQAAFQQRMAKRIMRQTSEAALGLDTASAVDAGSINRATLAPVHVTELDENGQPVRAPRQQQQRRPMQAFSTADGVRAAVSSTSSRQPAGLWGVSSSSAAAPVQPVGGTFSTGSSRCSAAHIPPQPPLHGAANGAKLFEVAVDEEFGASGSGVVPTAFPAAIVAGQQPNSQLPAYAVSRKENTSKPAEWTGTKLKQQAIFTAPVAPKLEVCEDDDLGDPEGQQQQQEPQQQAGSVRQQLEAKSVAASSIAAAATAFSSLWHSANPSAAPPTSQRASQQQQQPKQVQQQPAAAGATQAGSSHSRRTATAAASNAAAAGSHGYNESLLVGPDGAELSFEEIRAAAWRAAATHAEGKKQHKQLQQQQQQQRAQQNQSEQARLQQEQQEQQIKAQVQQKQMQERQALKPHHQAVLAVRADDSGSDGSPTAGGTGQPQQQHHLQANTVSHRHRQQHHQQQQQQAYATSETTVTVNTRAAFEAMNGMFGADDTTTMHGFSQGPRGTARYADSQAGRAASAAEPTVTLSTRAAFNAMNGMCGVDDTTTMHGFSLGPRGAVQSGAQRGRAAATAEPTVTINTRAAFNVMNGMFGGDDTTTMHGFSQGPRGARCAGGQQSRAAEPTVTINTRAAFDYMNDVFGDGQQTQTMAGRQMGMQQGKADRRGGTSRLSMAAAGPLSLYEDTDFVGARLANVSASAAGSNALGLCEDTEFMTRPVGGAAAGRGAADAGLGLCEDTEFITRPVGGAAAGRGAADIGLGLCEDTEFMTRPVGGAAAGRGAADAGLGLCEDTEFKTRPVGSAAAAAGRDGLDGSSNTFGLCEVTEFITRPVGGDAAAATVGYGRLGGTDALGLCEDTEYITRPVGGAGITTGRSNALGLCEDTEFIARPVAGAAGRGAGLSLYEDTEFVGAKLNARNAIAGLHLCEDTEFITRTLENTAEPVAQDAFAQHDNNRPRLVDGCIDTTTGLLRVKENIPGVVAAAGSSRGRLLGTLGQPAAGAAGSSRLGHSSTPSSPAHHQQQQQHPGPAWGAVTPHKPPIGPQGAAAITPGQRHTGTPGTPWARPMDEFEVMESPAVRAALAERPALAMSPVASMPSPGMGARENDPALAERHEHRVPRRSMHDRAARAAALQPLSDARAEQLGVLIESAAAPSGDGEEIANGCSRLGQRPQGRALRSLKFQPDGGK